VLRQQGGKQLLANMKIGRSECRQCGRKLHQTVPRGAIENAQGTRDLDPLCARHGNASAIVSRRSALIAAARAMAARSPTSRAASAGSVPAGAGMMDSQPGGAAIHCRTAAGVIGSSSSSRTAVGMERLPNSCGTRSIRPMSTK
jgi:hypothetical protein